MLLFALGMPEIVLIALVVLLLFGGKKIPEVMKGMGKGVRSFKEGLNDLDTESDRPAMEEDGKRGEAQSRQ